MGAALECGHKRRRQGSSSEKQLGKGGLLREPTLTCRMSLEGSSRLKSFTLASFVCLFFSFFYVKQKLK